VTCIPFEFFGLVFNTISQSVTYKNRTYIRSRKLIEGLPSFGWSHNKIGIIKEINIKILMNTEHGGR